MKKDHYLISKYNRPVPRYTSYPPANHFRDGFKAEEVRQLISESNSWSPPHLALYIHIPFCRSICHYCGCHSCSYPSESFVNEYVAALKAELRSILGLIDRERAVTQLHYGGGTPNAIPLKHIRDLNEFLFSGFRFIEDAEIAIECNPAYLDENSVSELAAAGFNRFSLGIQDFSQGVLKRVNRQPSRLPVHELVAKIKAAKPGASVNLDFIYGLPGQQTSSFRETIVKAIGVQPDRLVTFSYAHVPWIRKNQELLNGKELPSAEEKMDMFLAAYKLLKGAGYIPVGMDHYVRPGDELARAQASHQLNRNFQGYCTRQTTGQVYAFGVSSISQLEYAYIQNTKNLEQYIDQARKGRIAAQKGLQLTQQQVFIREVITEIMCNKTMEWSVVASRLNTTPGQLMNATGYREEQLEGLERDGLIRRNPGGIEVTEQGGLFIRNIASAFDPAYSSRSRGHSKTI